MSFKQNILIIIVSLLAIDSFSCCAEKQYRLFPIGQLNNSVVFIEFDFGRYCINKGGSPGAGINNEFWLSGKVNIVTSKGDSLFILDEVSEINIKECICDYKNHFEKSNYDSIASEYFNKALTIAKSKEGFQLGSTREIIQNDTANTIITESDSAYIIAYKKLFKLNLYEEDIISCYPSNVIEVKNYITKDFKVCIIRLSCNKEANHEILLSSKQKFKNIETAYWKEKPSWHGITKDYYLITKNN
mgnify:CR=1 FL=1